MAATDDAKKTAEKKDDSPRGEMTLLEHLGELRAVLMQSLIAIGAASVGAWFVSEPALDLLVKPAVGPSGPLVFLSPTGAFLMRLRLSFGLGAFLAAPIVVWRLWVFVVQGLLGRERSVLFPVILSSVTLFYLGAAFAYLVILPISLTFLMKFSTENLQPMIAGEHYFAFAIRLTLAFGAVFQFPLVISLLTYWEILGPDFLKKYWRYGVVLVFVASAVLTPPDVASQLLMAGPVLILYFLSLWLARMIARKRTRESGSASERDDEDERSR